ncbi:MAG: hypothetical protein RMK94_14875, partial [Armatimonadota bacterium]|nr:hypothetical protein [Armatimonadota bacterium]
TTNLNNKVHSRERERNLNKKAPLKKIELFGSITFQTLSVPRKSSLNAAVIVVGLVAIGKPSLSIHKSD